MEERRGNGKLIISVVLWTLILTVVLGFACLKLLGKTIVDEEAAQPAGNELGNSGKMEEISELLAEKFLYDYDDDETWESAYRGMLESLGDRYTRYLDSEEMDALMRSINSTYVGTGVVITTGESGRIVVSEVMKDSPAYNTGILAGDVIETIDEKSYGDLNDAAAALKGEAGTSVRVSILRGEERKEYTIVRGEITNASVEMSTLRDGIAYIRIRSFGTETYQLFDAALLGFETAGSKGLILDLRGNSGGLFNAGVQIADRLLPEGMITYTEDKDGERATYNSDSKSTTMPIIVLVDEYTASTAELLAGALKDGGATVLGKKTFGKGILQEVVTFEDGTAVNITIMEFFTPSGSKIHGEGIMPHVEVDAIVETPEDEQLEEALKRFS